MSMYGSVTDAQVFSRELSVKEMADYTTCRATSLTGDIITWEKESWTLKSPLQTSEEEILDLEKDICLSKDNGLFMVPHAFSFDESIHVCRKLSGELATYTNETEFDKIIHFLSQSSNMKTDSCVTVGDQSSNVIVWAGGTDEKEEGTFVTWNDGRAIQVL